MYYLTIQIRNYFVLGFFKVIFIFTILYGAVFAFPKSMLLDDIDLCIIDCDQCFKVCFLMKIFLIVKFGNNFNKENHYFQV